MSAATNFKKYFSKKNLENTFENYFKPHTATGIDKMNYHRFSEQKKEQIEIIHRKISNGTYKFTPYKEKLILKARYSNPRVISIPTVRDKLTLKTLHFVLTKTFDIQQKLPQVYISELKEAFPNYDYFLKIDISNFYDSIKHGILFDKLSKKVKKPEIINVIKQAITTPTVSYNFNKNDLITKGVPQGLPISNVLAHIYLNDLDIKYKNINSIRYIRYVDDILILCKKTDSDEIYNHLVYDLEAIYNLKINQDKLKKGLIIEGFEFLGYYVGKIYNGTISITVKEASIKKLEDSLIKLFSNYKYNSKKISPRQFLFGLNNKITGSISSKVNGDQQREHKYGWIFYFSQMEDIKVLHHLDWLIEQLITKFNLQSLISKDEIKSFVKAFYEIRYNIKKSNYIHRPDQLNINEKKNLLIDIFNIHVKELKSEKSIERFYNRFVYKPIRDYEKDIQKIKS